MAEKEAMIMMAAKQQHHRGGRDFSGDGLIKVGCVDSGEVNYEVSNGTHLRNIL